MLKKTKVKAIYLVELICDKCGNEMESSGMVLMTSPPQYEYVCSCGNKVTTNKHYPQIEYEYEEDNNVITT